MDKKDLVRKYLKNKKEIELVNLYIKDYEGSDIYIGVVYNNKINRYKVLYIPLDLVDNDIEEYVCYQFIRSNLVEFMIENLEQYVSLFQDEMFRFRYKYPTYKIEMSIFLEREYLFVCNRYIPREWEFLYDVLVMLFEHSPNMISEVCADMLSLLNTMDIVDYDKSYKFNLFKDKLSDIFPKKIINSKCEVKFLEYINNRYYGVVDKIIVIVEYNSRFKLLNVYCEDYDNNLDKVYAVLCGIINEKFRSFYKISIREDYDVLHYLCFGIEDNHLMVIDNGEVKLISCNLYKNGLLDIEYDRDGYLEENLK